MLIKEAERLKSGDKVKQKMHGYILIVERINEEYSPINGRYINVFCRTDNGELIKHNHKELTFLKN